MTPYVFLGFECDLFLVWFPELYQSYIVYGFFILRLTAVGIRCADHATPSTRKGWHQLRREAAVARSV
jgi:hypothetical protein